MRLKIYNFLVNRVPGIKSRYHDYHDGGNKFHNIVSYFYLIYLNFAYYILHFKWLGEDSTRSIFEEKKLSIQCPESQLIKHPAPMELVERLLKYDVISFDIFDTLIFRPFSVPTDLFYIIGQKLGYMDFKRIRVECEKDARYKKYVEYKSYEVNLADIWREVELRTGINANDGIAIEVETEMELCYANSYMKAIYDALIKAKKHIVLTSDMYLTSDILYKILEKCGFNGYEKLYVSCEMLKSKGQGDLFRHVISEQKNKYGKDSSIIHIGDNSLSDYQNAIDNGIDAYLYKNVNTNSIQYRTYDISPIIGGAYRGIVNNRLYASNSVLTANQEYGFIYGGLFILGYCHFIHEYCELHGIEKLLFLSRDGEIIKKVYNLLYENEDTDYVYISRLASAKWSADVMKYDYIRKMIRHKVGQKKTLIQILNEMELNELVENLSLMNHKNLEPDDILTTSNVNDFEFFINDNWDMVCSIYKKEKGLAKEYYKKVVGDAKKVVVIDIGWAGSGFIALKTLFERQWNINCEFTGIVAGTNSASNSEPDMSETFILDGSLVSYLYSSRYNRDLWKKHNPNLGYNLYFELLTSSPQPSFKGFKIENDGIIKPVFGKPEPNPNGINEIWEGITMFIQDYKEHFCRYPFMFNISGRDAYAPMLLAASHNEEYLKHVYENFELTVSVE